MIDRIIDQPDGPLAHAMSTPWLLTLTANALHNTPDISTQLLTCASQDKIRATLFDTLIPTAVAHIDQTNTKTAHYTADTVHTWLTTLANHLNRTPEATLTLDQVAAIGAHQKQRNLIVGLAGGLAGLSLIHI